MDFAENLKKYSNVRTISIAFPSSIFDYVPTPQLEAYLVGQVARAAVVFNVTEVIIFNELDTEESKSRLERLVKLFEYAECPQYLRKKVFGIQPDLKYAGLIHPLEAQHHLRTSQIDCPYREGITIEHTQYEFKGKQQDFTKVNIGLSKPVDVPGHLPLNTRVTVQVDPADLRKMQAMLAQAMQSPQAALVSPVEPIQKLNYYWGYYVRPAGSLSEAISDNIFVPGKRNFYDIIIGTSERGDCVDDVVFKKDKSNENQQKPSKKGRFDFNHILVVFGGVKGLEHSASCDKQLEGREDLRSIFDYYLNTCPNQGSTTIRTEEAILISLSALRPKLNL
jgi:predicted SPOUT superfamily RNA methylase MTH1